MGDSSAGQGQERISFKVRGMTCAHCEGRVERAALGIAGVQNAIADAAKGRLNLVWAGPGDHNGLFIALDAALQAEGYALAPSGDQGTAGRDMLVATALGAALALFFFMADHLGLFAVIPVIESGLSLGTLVVIGLLTSLHCVPMCGGIALSQGVRHGPSSPHDPLLSRLAPSLSYNLGRITSYTLIGAAVGAAGAALSIGPRGRAILLGLAGIFMLLMGLAMIGVLRLPRIQWPAYERLRSRIHGRAARLGPFIVGLANGFMPCGPLQAMQIYALGSGSAIRGALVPHRHRAIAVRAGLESGRDRRWHTADHGRCRSTLLRQHRGAGWHTGSDEPVCCTRPSERL